MHEVLSIELNHVEDIDYESFAFQLQLPILNFTSCLLQLHQFAKWKRAHRDFIDHDYLSIHFDAFDISLSQLLLNEFVYDFVGFVLTLAVATDHVQFLTLLITDQSSLSVVFYVQNQGRILTGTVFVKSSLRKDRPCKHMPKTMNIMIDIPWLRFWFVLGHFPIGFDVFERGSLKNLLHER